MDCLEILTIMTSSRFGALASGQLANFFKLLTRCHLLSEKSGLNTVEQTFQPTHELSFGHTNYTKTVLEISFCSSSLSYKTFLEEI